MPGAKVRKIRKYGVNSTRHNIIIDSARYEDITRDTYKCDKCNEMLDLPKDYKDNDTLYCPICGTQYMPRLQKVRKNIQFDIPTDQEHQPEPAITSFTSADYYNQVKERSSYSWRT